MGRPVGVCRRLGLGEWRHNDAKDERDETPDPVPPEGGGHTLVSGMPASTIGLVNRSVHRRLRAAQDTALCSPAVAFFSSPMLQKQPNAGGERRGTSASLFPVRSTALLGRVFSSKPGSAPHQRFINGRALWHGLAGHDASAALV